VKSNSEGIVNGRVKLGFMGQLEVTLRLEVKRAFSGELKGYLEV
jgi:hypothetical protein